MTKNATATHEAYLHTVRDIVIGRALERGTITETEAEKLAHTKLVYGVGHGARGVCYYDAWDHGAHRSEVVEITALGEESWVQLGSTLIHELGHVLAGFGAGHGKDWKACAMRLGFVRPILGAGQVYQVSLLDTRLYNQMAGVAASMADGIPSFKFSGMGAIRIPKPRACGAGVGSKGGQSRGAGSGSRLRLWECECERPVKVRVASDSFAAHCDLCEAPFHKVEKPAK